METPLLPPPHDWLALCAPPVVAYRSDPPSPRGPEVPWGRGYPALAAGGPWLRRIWPWGLRASVVPSGWGVRFQRGRGGPAGWAKTHRRMRCRQRAAGLFERW